MLPSPSPHVSSAAAHPRLPRSAPANFLSTRTVRQGSYIPPPVSIGSLKSLHHASRSNHPPPPLYDSVVEEIPRNDAMLTTMPSSVPFNMESSSGSATDFTRMDDEESRDVRTDLLVVGESSQALSPAWTATHGTAHQIPNRLGMPMRPAPSALTRTDAPAKNLMGKPVKMTELLSAVTNRLRKAGHLAQSKEIDATAVKYRVGEASYHAAMVRMKDVVGPELLVQEVVRLSHIANSLTPSVASPDALL